MKFFPAILIVGALLALFAHADAVPVSAHAAPTLRSGPWGNGQPTTVAAQYGKVIVLLF